MLLMVREKNISMFCMRKKKPLPGLRIYLRSVETFLRWKHASEVTQPIVHHLILSS